MYVGRKSGKHKMFDFIITRILSKAGGMFD
jgi:hypothetical protein